MLEDFLSIHDLTPYQFSQIMDLAREIKEKPHRFKNRLKNKILAMIFEKPSLRTRVTFEVGMLRLGGEAISLAPSDIQMGIRETPYDVGRNLERWVDAIMIRTFSHQIAVDLAQACNIPVINALTDLLHPCQAMADFFTLKEKMGDLANTKLAYIGDGNNVCQSLLFAAAKTGSKMAVATPSGFEPNPDILDQARQDGQKTGFQVTVTSDPSEAVKEADAVYTDVWASMGQESEKEKRAQIFAPYQVNRQLMEQAKKNALFMHCLPAHRGEEVTAGILDSPQSVVYDQAENRLHIQKAIMVLLLEKKAKT
ncbi:MAG: ornithine carbamoyltransferase [Candidatus Aminicenantes bacterium]|jgi:ornithine carbamoyltransferase|nr:ornithine carbamoyltransferase [Candidatus Aminicenantes bacterium]MDH5386412.1 ornithine carbamoyltransferase [Candidatus Aminicenantes bacterium]MDH5743620.1 ornithine carbamoyltransferase [Candidatus Aminicenantes bacterium]